MATEGAVRTAGSKCPARGERQIVRPIDGAVHVQLHPFRHESILLEPDQEFAVGDWILYADQLGEELGYLIGVSESDSGSIQSRALRRAEDRDLAQREENRRKATDDLRLFGEMVSQFHLPMKAIDAHLRFDRREICFYFVSDERLNFRALHKSISSVLNMRVAIRQVGVRDYSRALGGIGPCGRVLCCAGFLRELRPITLRMARQQSLFVEPSKISGICGKLLCCLGFEAETYSDAETEFPRVGSSVKTAQGIGHVTAIDVLHRKVTLSIDDAEIVMSVDDVEEE